MGMTNARYSPSADVKLGACHIASLCDYVWPVKLVYNEIKAHPYFELPLQWLPECHLLFEPYSGLHSCRVLWW